MSMFVLSFVSPGPEPLTAQDTLPSRFQAAAERYPEHQCTCRSASTLVDKTAKQRCSQKRAATLHAAALVHLRSMRSIASSRTPARREHLVTSQAADVMNGCKVQIMGLPVFPAPVGAATTILESEQKAVLKVALWTGLKYLHAWRACNFR